MATTDAIEPRQLSGSLEQDSDRPIWADRSTRRPLMLGLVLVFFVALLLALNDASSDYISPWDEGYHLSYVQYMSRIISPDREIRWDPGAGRPSLVIPCTHSES